MALEHIKPIMELVGGLAIVYGSALSIRVGRRARLALGDWLLNAVLWAVIALSFWICSR